MSKKKENGAARYYSRLGYSLGYNLVLGRSQHAGYWWEGTKNEREAQQSFLEEFAKLLNLQSSERVLDAGSGQGVMACYLAEKTGAKLIGATITPREVRVSNKLSKGMKNALKFVIGDYMNTDFLDDYFDVVYVNETDWTNYAMPTYHRSRRFDWPLVWIKPRPKLTPHCLNAVIASHGYSSIYEDGRFRYLIYRARIGTKDN